MSNQSQLFSFPGSFAVTNPCRPLCLRVPVSVAEVGTAQDFVEVYLVPDKSLSLQITLKVPPRPAKVMKKLVAGPIDDTGACKQDCACLGKHDSLKIIKK